MTRQAPQLLIQPRRKHSRRHKGWRRWFTVTVDKFGGPDDDCWHGQVRLLNDDYPLWSTFQTTEETARKNAEFYARRLAKTVKACMTMEAT